MTINGQGSCAVYLICLRLSFDLSRVAVEIDDQNETQTHRENSPDLGIIREGCLNLELIWHFLSSPAMTEQRARRTVNRGIRLFLAQLYSDPNIDVRVWRFPRIEWIMSNFLPKAGPLHADQSESLSRLIDFASSVHQQARGVLAILDVDSNEVVYKYLHVIAIGNYDHASPEELVIAMLPCAERQVISFRSCGRELNEELQIFLNKKKKRRLADDRWLIHNPELSFSPPRR